jgi:hypothetical protein
MRMDTLTDQKPAQPPAKKRSSERGIGIFMVIGSGVLGYLAVVLPLQEAARHEEEISVTMKAVAFVPALFGVGLMLIFSGNKSGQIFGTRERPSPLGIIVCVVMAVVGILMYEWLKSRLRGYGYDF